MPRRISRAGFLFLLCFSTGVLSSLVSVPPYALNALWPPSGLALIAVYLWGRSYLLPSILGMAFAFSAISLIHFHEHSDAGVVAAGASVMSLVFVAQILFGAALLRRFVPLPAALTYPRPILAFLLITGPVQSLVSAMLGPLLPMSFGVWPWYDYPRIAFDWWRSEMIGSITFALFLLCLAGEPKDVWRRRRLTVALPLAVWMAIFVMAYFTRPMVVTNAGEFLRLGIEVGGSLVLVLLAALLLVITGQSAVIREEAERIAAELSAASATQRSTESALALSDARLELAQGIARIGAWEWDPINDKVIWSDMMYRLFGYEPGGMVPTYANFIRSVHPDDRRLVETRMESAIRNELPYEFDFRVVHPDGTIRVLHVQARIDRNEHGMPTLWRGTDLDVTDRVKAVEEQRRLDERLRITQRWESLGQLAGGVAHDFNNLMAGVLGHATLARESLPDDSPLHDLLRPVEEAAHHAASLCQQLLTYAGKGDQNRQPIDLVKLLGENHDLLRMGVPRQIELRFKLPETLPYVDGDPSQIRQVLTNLVWNATDAIGGNPGTIEIRAGSCRGGSCTSQTAGHFCSTLAPVPYVWVEVRDTGSGIAPEIVSRLFDPFFTTKDVGRGLGLSAVAGIVHAHRGVVCVTSRQSVGSCFRVYLTAADDPDKKPTPRPVVNTPRQIPPPSARETLVQGVTEIDVQARKKIDSAVGS